MTMRSEPKPDREFLRLQWRGMRLLSRYIPHFFAAVTWHSIIMAITPYVVVWFAATVLDALVDGAASSTLCGLSIAGLSTGAVLSLVGGILKRFKESKWEQLYQKVDRVLMDVLLEADHATIDDRYTIDLLAKVRENTDALGAGLVRLPDLYQRSVRGIVGVAAAPLTVGALLVSRCDASGGVYALVDHPATAVLTAALLVATVGGSLVLSRRAERVTSRETDAVVALDRSYYAFYDVMFDASKAADVRLYRQDGAIGRYLDRADRAFFEKGGIKRRRGFGIGGVLQALAAGSTAIWWGAVLCLATIKLHGGAFTFGETLLFVGAAVVLWERADDCCRSVAGQYDNAPYLKTMFAFLDIPHRLYQGSLTTEKRADRDYEIEFRRVTFTYPDRPKAALNDVSVTLCAGQRLAIVGENGSGKSTFVKLLCRLYDPDEGAITLNGIDIRKYRYSDYIALVSAVFQDFRLLAQPLGNAVAGTMDYDRERATKCLDHVGLNIAALPDGLDTPLYREGDENGVAVSLGDAQKIAIARALYKDAPLIILDEPTAALDPITEAEIYADLDRIVADRTAIFVSHRLSSCRFCDEILVFDDGAIVQRGTHEALLTDKNGKYYELWNAQAQYYTS